MFSEIIQGDFFRCYNWLKERMDKRAAFVEQGRAFKAAGRQSALPGG